MTLATPTRTAVAFASAAAHPLSRTNGIPGLDDRPEPIDPVGSTVSLLEVAAAAVLAGQFHPRRNR